MTTPSNKNPTDTVNGVDLGEVVLMSAKDKLVMVAKHSSEHLTLHLGPHSGEMDIHKTVLLPGGAVTHTRLFAITHAELGLLLQEVGPALATEMARLILPLRPGWMERNQIGAVLGLIPPESEMAHVTKVRRKRLSVEPEKLKASVRVPDSLAELYALPDGGSFSVFSFKNPGTPRFVGIGFKATAQAGRPHLVWIKNRNALQAVKRLAQLVEASGRKRGRVVVEPPWF